MTLPMRPCAGMLRCALTLALTLAALGWGSKASAQRALRLDTLEVVPMARAHARRGDVTRWGLSYARAGQGRRAVHLEVTLIPAHRRERARTHALQQPAGVLPVGASRGPAIIRVRAVDRQGRTLPIRLGRGPRLAALELLTPDRLGGYEPDPPQPPQPPPVWTRPPTVDLAAVDRACRDAFTGNANEMRCLTLMRGHHDPVTFIAACERAFSGDRYELACLQTGAAPSHVDGCERLFSGDTTELACLETIGSHPAHPHEVDQVLQVCESRPGDQAELACIGELLSGVSPRRGR